MEIFDDTFLPQGLSLSMGWHCPRCVWVYLRPVGSFDQPHLLCESCGHVEHGRIRPVDPVTCHGCAARSKDECIALLREHFPTFGPAPTESVAC